MRVTVNGKDLAAMARREEQYFEIILTAVRMVTGLVVLLMTVVGLGR